MTTPPLLMIAEGRRPRARKALVVRASELSVHLAVADVLRRFAKPTWVWLHYPSGEARDPRIGQKLKAMGVRRGIADFLLFSPDGGRLHALELKRIDGRLSEDQEGFAKWCGANGVPHQVARTVDEALVALNAWGCLRVGIASLQKGGAA